MPLKDETGKKFGTLTVLRRKPSASKHAVWTCRCDCGVEADYFATNLRTGSFIKCSGSPGCHGSPTPYSPETYSVWHEMVRRCHDERSKSYRFYGAIGISVCEEWRRNYSQFVSDMGIRPNKLHSIDRINTHENYQPDNCRWATKIVQMNNMKSNRLVTFRGEQISLSEAIRRSGFKAKYYTVRSRLIKGWDIISAIETPASKGVGRG